jgi:uncharacterized protein (TIGR02145 family)
MEPAVLELGGKIYNTITLGNQLWMAENLSLLVKDSWFYENNAQHGAAHGRLYSWQAALDACPEGWRLPSVQEWQQMIDSLGSMEQAYHTLCDPSGFHAVFSGYRSPKGDFMSLDRAADFWTSSPAGDSNAWLFYLISKKARIFKIIDDKRCGFSVRYIKDLQ